MELKPGYKQTEVGIIPEQWELTPLVQLIDESRSIRYGIVQPGRFDPAGRYMVRGQDYSKGWVAPSELFKVSPQVEEPFKNARVKAGDVIITIVGASTGHIEVIPQWLDGANLTQTTARLAINPSKAFSGFCKFYLQSSAGQRQVANYLKGAAQPGLNCGDIEKFTIPLPPTLPEQRAIAEALSDVDALLGALDRLIAKKRDFKQAAMQQLLTGQTRLPGFHGEWEVKRLGEIADVKTGPFGSTLHESDYVRDGTPIITVEHLGEFGVEHFNLPLVSDYDRQRLRAYSLEVGDIVFSRVGSVDRNALIRAPEAGWLFSGRLLRVGPDKQKAFAPFLSYQFHGEAFKSLVRNVAVGQTMACLNTKILKGIFVTLPRLPEQIAIAEVLTDMDAELAALEQRREKTCALKQAMMQELLTGRTRLVSPKEAHA